jgi:hypothetical protein
MNHLSNYGFKYHRKYGRSVDSNIVLSSSGDTILNESQLVAQEDKQFSCGN